MNQVTSERERRILARRATGKVNEPCLPADDPIAQELAGSKSATPATPYAKPDESRPLPAARQAGG